MSVKMRQLVEREVCNAVVKALLDAGFSLGVYDGEDLTIHHSRSAKAIKKALYTTDEDYLYVYVKGGDRKDSRPDYWVRFVYGNDGWDVINDYSTYLESWFAPVQKLIDKYAD